MSILLETSSFLTNTFSLEIFEKWYLYDSKNPLLFNSGLFLVMFAVFYGVYINVLNKKHLRNLYVVVFSLFFYYKCSG